MLDHMLKSYTVKSSTGKIRRMTLFSLDKKVLVSALMLHKWIKGCKREKQFVSLNALHIRHVGGRSIRQ